MRISMYSASVPVFQRYLGNLSLILEKAEAHAAARQIDQQALLQARLFPDMLPLIRQVQIAVDFAKRACAPLAGVALPQYDNSEQTFADLRVRIARTLAFIDALPEAQIDGSEEREIVDQAGREIKHFNGHDFLLQYALPNFYFHVMSAYAILRHNGIELGKRDFDGHHVYTAAN